MPTEPNEAEQDMKTLADQFAETLAIAGVKRIYGIVGDSLNGLTDAVRRQGKVEWLHVRHEEDLNDMMPAAELMNLQMQH
jgi:hypothetical protein